MAWMATRNVFGEPEQPGQEMEATAAQSQRADKPAYHLSISAAPGKHLPREPWEAAADRVLGALGIEEHQVLIVAHGDAGHEHIHLMANRGHPEMNRTNPLYLDWPTIDRELVTLERERGLETSPRRRQLIAGQELSDPSRSLTSGG